MAGVEGAKVTPQVLKEIAGSGRGSVFPFERVGPDLVCSSKPLGKDPEPVSAGPIREEMGYDGGILVIDDQIPGQICVGGHPGRMFGGYNPHQRRVTLEILRRNFPYPATIQLDPVFLGSAEKQECWYRNHRLFP